MSKAIKNKLVVLLSVMMIACVSIGVGVFGFAGASTPFTFSDFAFNKMASSVMIDGEDGKDGLTFSVTTSLEDYDGLKGIVGEGKDYVSMETGIIIAPNYYNDNVAINKASVFDKGATYDYAEWNGENYVYNGNKIRVININANDWKVVDNEMVYTGSIVDILSKNIAEEFYAVAYVKVTDINGNENYVFSQSVVTSMAYETQIAIENETLGDKASYAQANFVDVVTEKFTYTTEYYKKVLDGYELIESVVSEETYKLDAIVNAEIKNYQEDNLEYIEGYEKEVLSGKVKANGKLTLKVYYGDAEAEVINFNTLSNVVVTKGAKVLIETPAPVDQYGKLLTVYFDVVDEKGGHVATYTDEDGEYFYANGTEYTISYAVYPYDKKVTIKETTVQVAGTETVNVNYDKVVEVGSEVVINAVSGLYNPVFTYTVTKDADSSSVAVADGKFTPDTVGYYTVNVKATYLGKEAETSYKVYARTPEKAGEIESFYADWNDLRAINGYDAKGWTVTSTEENGLKNFKDENDYYATYEMSSGNSVATFWLDALYSHEEYLAMIDEGYTHVTFRVFIDATTNKQLYLDTDKKIGGSLTVELDELIPNTWNTVNIYFSHVMHSGCLDRDFLAGFVLWDAQDIGFIRVKNNGSENFKIYIDDIYATKDATPSENTSASKDFETGNTYDLTSIVTDNGVDYTYLIKNNTAKESYVKVADPTKYTFTASGDYQIKVIPTEYCYRGSNEFSFTVTDDITVKTPWTKVQMTEEDVTVNFANIGAILMDGETEISTTVTGVYFHDDYKVDASQASVTINKVGYYKIYLEGTYGEGYKTYKQVDLDVYTANDQYVMARVEDYVATRYWDYQALPPQSAGEFEIAGETVRAFKMGKKPTAGTIVFRPAYSKAYYVEMNETYEATVNFETYYMGTAKTHTRLMPKKLDYNNYNVWNSQKIDLSWFIDNYETIAKTYAEVAENYRNGGNPGIAFGNYMNGGTGNNAKYKSYIYMVNSNSCKSDIYVKDLTILAALADNNIYMVETKDMVATTYDVTTSFGAKGIEALEMYAGQTITYRLTDTAGKQLNTNILDLTKDASLRLWLVEAIANGSVFYKGYVDVYDSSDAPFWGELTADAVTVYKTTDTLAGVSGELTTFQDKAVVKFTRAKFVTSHQWFVIEPAHSKAYYELYKGQGYKLVFSNYVETESSGEVLNQYFSYGTQVSYRHYINNTWFERSINLDTFLTKWDNYTACHYDGAWGTRNAYGMFYYYLPQADFSMYVTQAVITK